MEKFTKPVEGRHDDQETTTRGGPASSELPWKRLKAVRQFASDRANSMVMPT